MKFRIKSVIILSVLLGAGVFLYHHVHESDISSRTNQAPIVQPEVNPAVSLTRAEHEGAFIAILVVPKVHRQVLEKFSRLKIAEEIQIIPANMGWNENELIVVPLQQPGNSADGSIIQNNKGLTPTGEPAVREAPKEEKAIWAFALLRLLAENASQTH